MRKLESVIASLSKQEIRNFKIYANRIKTINRQKKILLLFDAYKSGKYKDDDKLMEVIFPELNKNAFYRLRNRLLDEIDQSLLLLYNNMDDKIIVTRCIMLAKISYHKNDYKSAHSLLLEAERQALKSEFYDILNVIYNEIIALSSYYPQIDPRVYIKKITDSEKKFATLNELNRLIAEIAYDLRGKNYQGDDPKAVQTLKKINERLNASDIINNSSQAKLKVYTCIRDILHQEKKIAELQNYLIQTYNSFVEQNIFVRTYHREKVEMLIWLVNTLLKAKEFSLSLEYIALLKKELLRYNKLYYDKYQSAYFQALFSTHYFSGQVPAAIEVLTKLKDDFFAERPDSKVEDLSAPIILLFWLNLAMANYSIQRYDEAMDAIKVFFLSEVFKKLSNRWKLSIFIVEIIIRYENGDDEFTLSRIREVKRNLRNILAKEVYAREKEFLTILRKLANNPNILNNKNAVSKIQAFVDNSPPFEPGSNETISYKVFLESVLSRTTYFEALKKYLNVKIITIDT